MFPFLNNFVRFSCSQEWEGYAARAVSMEAEVAALRGLVTRWREAELASWSLLLRGKEREYARRATAHWFALMRGLLTAPDVDYGASQSEDGAAGPGVGVGGLFAWPGFARIAPAWLAKSSGSAADAPTPLAFASAPVDVVPDKNSSSSSAAMSPAQYLLSLFDLLDGFLKVTHTHAHRALGPPVSNSPLPPSLLSPLPLPRPAAWASSPRGCTWCASSPRRCCSRARAMEWATPAAAATAAP